MNNRRQLLIDELVALLTAEAAGYGDLQNVLVEEADAMGLSGRRRFERVQREKEDLAAALQGLEKARVELVERIADTHSIDDRPITVSRLADILDAPHRDRLLAAAQRLRALVGEVQRQHRSNRRMLRHYADLIKGSLQLLMDTVDPCVVYHRPGHHAGGGLHTGGGRVLRGAV